MSTTPHDALFKAIFSQREHAEGELRHVLPQALTERLDFATLTLCPGSFIDEALKERQTDLLFSVSLAGEKAFVYILTEHQRTVDPLMIFRILRYLARIWETYLNEHPQEKRLPVIVPVVLHHSATGWTAATRFEDVLQLAPDLLAALGEYVPRLRFVLDDLSLETDETLRARAMSALGRLGLLCLRHAPNPSRLVQNIRDWVDLLHDVRRAPNGAAALMVLWRYILTVNESPRPEELVARLTEAIGEAAKEEIVTVADMLREEGRQEGRQEALEEGLRNGQRTTLLKQLRTRFGTLPEAAVTRVNTAESAQLDLWLERVLTASTLAEVLGET